MSQKIKRRPLIEPKMKPVPKSGTVIDPRALTGFIAEAMGGMPNKEIAARYGVSVATVKAFKSNIPRDLQGEVAFADPTRMFGANTIAAFNPSDLVTRKGLRIFDDMKKDDQVKAALAFKKLAVLSAGWEVSPPKEKPKDWEPARFIDYCLSHVEGSLNDCLMEVMTALEYGYSVTEMVFEPIAEGEFQGMIGLKALKTRKPHFLDFRTDDYGNLQEDGIIQRNARGIQTLPLRKFIVFVHQPEFGNHYGRSELEACYRSWWIKENAYRWLAMLLERYGIPPIFALYNPRSLTTQQAGDLRRVLERLQAATAGALPRVSKDDLELWSPQLAGQTNSVFIPALDMFNRDISRALLMPGLLGMTADAGVGSLARSKTHFDAFMLTVGQLQGRLGETAITDNVIDLLMAINYNEEVKPRFAFLEVDDTAMTELMTAWGNLVDKSVVRTQKEDEDHIRQAMGFPERQSDDLDEQGAALPKNQQPLPTPPFDPNAPDPNAPPDPNNPNKPTKPTPDNPGRTNGKEPKTPVPLDGKEPKTLALQVWKTGPEVPAPGDPFVHAAGAVKLARAVNAYEKQVDFDQINRSLDEMQSKHVEQLVKALTEIRERLKSYLRKNFDRNAVAVRTLELRGTPKLRTAVVVMLDDSFARGRKAMATEIAKVAKTTRHAAHKPNYKPTDAITYLRTQADFTVSGINADLTKKVKQRLLNAISSGEYIEDTIRNIQSDFEPYIGDPNVIRDGEQIQPYRVETIVRTNLTDAFNRGRIVEARQAEEFLDGFEWSSVLDSATTEVCQFLDGKLFRPDDQWLDVLSPPRHFNCRSLLVAVPVGVEIDEEDFITDGEAGKAQDLSGDGFTDKTKVRYLEYLSDDRHFYDPSEPREPAGGPGGGQWTGDGGGGGGLSEASAEDFIDARGVSSRQQFLTPHGAEDLKDHKLYLSEDGKVGYALDKEGDLQNVFNNGGPKGAGSKAVLDAIKNGAKTLDAYDGFLANRYSQLGFKAVARIPFNDEYAPPGWDYDKLGRPDVVFMSYQGGDRGTIAQRVGSFPAYKAGAGKVFSDYDQAKALAKSTAMA